MIYLIDNCSISAIRIILLRDPEIQPTLEEKVASLVGMGSFASVREVKRELDNKKLHHPFIGFLFDLEDFFLNVTARQLDYCKEIVNSHPNPALIIATQRHADVPLLAKALEFAEDHGKEHVVIVTEENRERPHKLPVIASGYGIDCISVHKFLRVEFYSDSTR